DSTRSTKRTVASLRSTTPPVYGRGGSRPSAATLPEAPLEARSERRARHGPQHLLLVVDRAAAVRRHAGSRIVRRDRQRVDVRVRDREAEVVADEAATGRARIIVARTRVLRDAADLLARLIRIPGELRDADVAADR